MSVRRAIVRAERLLPGMPVPDPAPDPRWQAILKIANFIETEPEEIWQFVRRWGVHRQEDLRTAIACCLLEHLLEFHFEMVFPRVESAVKQRKLFADTFSRCWRLGQADLPDNRKKFDRLQKWCRIRS